MSVLFVSSVAVMCLWFLILKKYSFQSSSRAFNLSYPPGPKAFPLVGNIFDIPKEESWVTYATWGKLYGPIIHMSVGGVHFVVLNSLRVVVDLFEKRSSKYSDKPVAPMMEMMDWFWALSLMPYGERWRLYRREFHQQFRAEKNKEYLLTIMKSAHGLARNVLTGPEKLRTHIQHFAGAVIMSIVYGYEVAPENDPFIAIAQEAQTMLNSSTFPGAAIVNLIPFLRHLPAWLPGMGFKLFAKRSSELTKEMREAPIGLVKAHMESGAPTTSVATTLTDRLSASADNGIRLEAPEETIKNVAAMGYIAGSDTTVSAISTSILAMVLYPEARENAQKEIDRVVGNSRLPEFDDRPSLPFVEAFLREVFRWHPALPLATAHRVMDDDIYAGYFIPKGANILMNTWALHQDEAVYGSETEKFKPERFLEPDGSISRLYPMTAFGAGRRICAGRHTADASVWAVTVLMLALFNATKAKDEVGNEIDVVDHYTNGLVSHP